MRTPIKKFKPYIALFLILVIAYLPLSTFHFGMKNDAFSDNFPHKYFFSEALHSGIMPLWNPYMNFGFPIYADPGFGFWNPITWFLGFWGYNACILTVEVLLYIYFGGIFMFRLCRYFNFYNRVSIVIAAMYMCSGFYCGSLQYINFLTAAAFLPFAVEFFLRLLNNPSFKNSFYFAIAVYFVFAGGHPAIPIGFVYFLLLLFGLFILFTNTYRKNLKRIVVYFLAALGLFILLYLPAIYSYANIMEVYARNTASVTGELSNTGFSASSYISFIFPFATAVKNGIFNDDVAMRNAFFSITGFIAALLSFKGRNIIPKIFFITALLMLIISFGGDFKTALFSKLPLLNYVRTNGEYRIFSILCFTICAGFGLQQIVEANKLYVKPYKQMLLLVLGIGALLFIMSGYFLLKDSKSVLGGSVSIIQKIKLFFDDAPFSAFLLISALITALVAILSFYAVSKSNYRLLLFIVLADLTVNSIIYLPVTGVGRVTLKEIQSIYDRSGKGIGIPELVPVNKQDTLDWKTTSLVGDYSYYSKKIGTTRLTDYPSYFILTEKYFNDSSLVSKVSSHPYLFIKNEDSLKEKTMIKPVEFTGSRIAIFINSSKEDMLVYLQNNYRYWNAEVNNKKVDILPVYTTFMSVPLKKGPNNIVFYYRDKWLPWLVLISISSFILSVVIVLKYKPTYKPSTQNQ